MKSSSSEKVMPDLCSRRRPYNYITALLLLHRMGVDLRRVELYAAGTHRNYRGEVHEQIPRPGAVLNDRTKIRLHIGMASAVDHLPYQFFYGLAGGTARRSGWEEAARSLMAPFDGSVARYRAITVGDKLRYLPGLTDTDHFERFLDMFRFRPQGSANKARELFLWSLLMPSFHKWAGNAEAVAGVLSLVYGFRFRIVENVPGRFDIPSHLQARLGKRNHGLGSSFALGNQFCECDSKYQVHIHGVSPDQAAELQPQGDLYRRILQTINYCMPGHLECQIVVHVSSPALRLGRSYNESRLGYATYL
ncbi:MAG: type VI secretion system baseplate subunit TssG [bacterium]